MEEFKKKVKRYVPLIFVVLVIFLFIHYWDNLMGLGEICLKAAMSLIIGVIIAYIVNILMTSFENLAYKLDKKKRRTTKLRRLLCMTLAFVVIIAIIVMIVVVVGPEFVKSLISVLTNAQDKVIEYLQDLKNNELFGKYAEQLLEMMPSGSDIGGIIEKVGGFLLNGASGAFTTIASSVTSIINGIVQTLIGFVFSMYILFDKERLKRQFSELIRVYVYKGEGLLRIADILNENFHNYIVAQVLDAVILGTLCGVGMWILRFPYPALTGVVIAFTALIPIVGAFLGAAVAAFIIFTVSPIKALLFIIYLLILQQIDNKFIYPKVVGSYVNLDSLWVLVAITIGGSIFGITGMLCGVPITATVYQLIKEDYLRRKELKKKNGEENEKDNDSYNTEVENSVEALVDSLAEPEKSDSSIGSSDNSGSDETEANNLDTNNPGNESSGNENSGNNSNNDSNNRPSKRNRPRKRK
ncbi:MAG: AI-2E family transporter [Eubacterium sp.]|nr:AI-2E family transporter [Eubacterium sp.]